MKQNVGTTERAIRLLLAVALVSVALFVPVSYYVKLALYAAAAIAVITAAVGFCPLWGLFGINTCARR
jgi:hypothetical protein